jgi:Uma2 family endonuclease
MTEKDNEMSMPAWAADPSGMLITEAEYEALPAEPWSDDVLVAIEITSSDEEADFNDKRAEYAAQGIPVYLIVVLTGSEIDSVAKYRLDSVAEYRLDWSGRNYQLVTVHRRSLTTDLPEGMKLDVPFRQLEQV